STTQSYVPFVHNVTVAGSDAGLSWLMQNYGGTLVGDAYESNDVNNKVVWQSGNTCQLVTSQATGNWSNSSTWNTGFIPTACNAVLVKSGNTVSIDINTATDSTTTVAGT